jgi:hypothetical protein
MFMQSSNVGTWEKPFFKINIKIKILPVGQQKNWGKKILPAVGQKNTYAFINIFPVS